MRNLTFLLLLALWATNSLFAQTNLTGNVQDSLNRKPLAFATVALLDSAKTPIRGVLTDEKGDFIMEKISNGNYTLEATSVGFRNKSLAVTIIGGSKTQAIAPFLLPELAANLKAVTITGVKPMLVMGDDKIVYNAENDPSVTGATTLEVLRKLPYLSVDNDDNLKVKGSTKFKVKINGKSSGIVAKSPKDALRSFPANTILKIEIITNPSAKDDAEGGSAVINIITKKRLAGYNASIGGSANTLNSFHSYASLDAKMDKVGFSGYANQGSNLPNRNYGQGKTVTNPNSENPFTQTNIYESKRGYNWYWAGTELAWDIDSSRTLSLYANFNGGGNSGDGTGTRSFSDKLGTISKINTAIRTEKGDNPSQEFGADYIQKWGETDREFTISVKHQNDYQKSLTYTQNDFQYPSILKANYRNYNINTNQESTFTIDYTHPLDSTKTISTGLKGIMRSVKSDYGQEELSTLQNNYIKLPQFTNKFDYQQSVFGAYLDFRWKLSKKCSIRLGLRGEETFINAQFESTNTIAAQRYFALVPSFSCNYKLSDNTNWRFSYNRQLSRPGVYYLNPFVNNSNPQAISTGNPDLTPEFTNDISLEFSYFKNGFNVTTSAFYRNTTDMIQNYTTIADNNVSFTKFYNLGTSQSTGISLSVSGNIVKNLSFNTNLDFYNITYNSFLDGQTQTTSGVTGWGWGNLSYKFGKGWSTGLNGYGSPNNVDAQGISSGWWGYGWSASKTFKKDAVRVRVYADNFANSERTYIQRSSSPSFTDYSINYSPARAFGLGLTVKFGELKESVSRKKGIENTDTKSSGKAK